MMLLVDGMGNVYTVGVRCREGFPVDDGCAGDDVACPELEVTLEELDEPTIAALVAAEEAGPYRH